ncbi:unnamed protein product, partial [Allacma fusca]
MFKLSVCIIVICIFGNVFPSENNCSSDFDVTSTNDPLELRQLYPYYVAGFDYDNFPVVVIECGHWDHLFVAQNPERYTEKMKQFKIEFFGCLDSISQLNHTSPEGEVTTADQFGMILDFDGFSLKHVQTSASATLMLSFWKGFKRFDNNVAYGFYINMNAVAENFVLLSKPLLSKAFGRSQLYGTRKQSWIPALHRKMPRSILQPLYGGENKCYKEQFGCLLDG